MKRGIFLGFCIFLILFLIIQISALPIENNIPIQIQTTDASGNIITGTFTFTINISNSNTCSPILYSNSTTRTTDARGIVSYNLENVDLDFDEQYWFCYYRDGVFKETAKVGRMPYAFRAKNITLSGVEVDKSLDMGGYNVTASYFIGDGSQLTNISSYSGGDNWVNESGDTMTGNLNLSGNNITNVNTGFFGWLGDLTNRITKLFVIDVNVSNNVSVGGNLTVNTDTLFVDSANSKVGIGTTTPSQKLEVVGAIQLSDNSGSNEAGTIRWTGTEFQAYNGTDWNTFGTTGGGASLWSQTGNDIYYNNGNVGIGTASPEIPLHVVGPILSDGGWLGSKSISPHIFLNQTDETDMNARIQAEGTLLKFAQVNALNSLLSTPMLINLSSGNVGIGTTNPQVKLAVEDTSTNPIIQVGRNNDWKMFFKYDLASNNSYIQTVSQSYGGNLLLQPEAGNVGIGTTAPQNLLHIAESTGTFSRAQFTNSDSGSASGDGVLVGLTADEGGLLWVYENTYIKFGVNDTEHMRILANGNVGIGTTSPLTKLSITGNESVTAGVDRAAITLQDTGAAEQWTLNIFGTASGEGGGKFGINEVGVGTRFVIVNNTGNVGIGITTPSHLLTIGGSLAVNPQPFASFDNNDWFTMSHTSGYGAINWFTKANGTNYVNTHATVKPQQILSSGTGLIFLTAPTNAGSGQVSTLTNRMIIDNTGNVGIGTTSPTHKLNVLGSANISGGVLTDNVVLKTKVIEIGDWNMDTAYQKIIAHGLADYKKIRVISIIIRDDSDINYTPLNKLSDNPDPLLVGGGVDYIGPTSIYLYRRTSGVFDSTFYDSTSYNRGWITITYEA